jgi:methionyl-tRNA synthetase
VSRYYITTPIYYVNDVPHLGTAFCTIAADALARYHRARGEETWFLTGTDEHGQKIQQSAAAANKSPAVFADGVVERFVAAWKHLDISNNDFIRTTDDRHKQFVTELWRRIADAGDIYLGSYEGWYCVRCEAFYTEGQLDDNKCCPIHGTRADWVQEPSYFFRMSKYQEPLLAHFEANPTFVQPDHYRREIVSFIRSGLRDLSISRASFNWGISVPGDEKHVIYVWLDALANYISALGGPGTDLYNRFWPANCHLIGKDILRFHAVYWPCFLMSAGLPLPRSIVVTGFWNVRGQKISKSIPATRVDPNRLADDIGNDALRYFLLREVPLGLDGDFAYESLIARYNADLANDLGNLLHRTVTMTGKFCGGVVPPAHPEAESTDLARVAAEVAAEAAEHFAKYAPSKALEAIWRLIRAANQHVDASQPWKLAKDPERQGELEHTMHSALEALYWAALMVAPVMPHKAAEVLERLGFAPDTTAAHLLRWPDPTAFNRELPAGLAVVTGPPIFPRIDDDRAAELLDRWMPGATASSKPAAANEDERDFVTFDDFKRLDLRVAQVKAAESVPKADRLLRLELDVGGETRQVVAGIASRYRPEDLIGRKVIFLANLKPAKIRGVTSEGMVLAAGDKEILGLSAVDADVPPGTAIR